MASTAGASQLITVTNDGSGTSARLQAFTRTSTGWRSAFGPYPAKIGAGGFSHHVSEQTVASPIGSFTLTRAFGNDADPGSGLPYHHVSTGDVWVDNPASPNYNTLQTADTDGSRGSGEKLWTVIGLYDYAAVIDYNTGPVVPGAGSAFFLHVTDGRPTAGCVSIPAADLVPILRWLRPTASPRIAMGPLSDVLAM